MRIKKNLQWMAIKIDLEKAFDRVRWDFIEASLIAAGIPLYLIKVIMNVISLSSTQILSISAEEWIHIRLSRNGLSLSHLFFANDLVIFSQADLKHNGLLKNFLSDFCEISGHKEVNDLGHFLRVPLLHKRLTKSILDFLVEKVRKGKRKIALVKWNDICQPKIHGGLGLRRLEDQNKAFMMKIGYKLITKPEALWVQVLISKYGMSGNMPTSIIKSNYSYMWKAVAKVWPLLCSNMIWTIDNGRTVRCWEDNWVPSKGLLKYYVSDYDTINPEITVSNMVLPNRGWNLNLFILWLPEDTVRYILSIPPPSVHSGSDFLSWSKTTSGVFSVKNAYYLLKEESWHPKEKSWTMLWKILGSHRVKHFIWLVF
ncbi:hypothetical protein J1N35_015154 [Gossypium stocksii]|uniref:Reverse transcriptase domain-containing protein n=1 Tax=Gossypium stocksii TaxID=47602 RepID=A0A9D3VWP3_9ROSI|nr:hypothetical protein J1N35_015154 [Gossypium stocksii]